MKLRWNWMLVATILLCLLMGTALAAVPANALPVNYHLEKPDGLLLSETMENGVLTVTVDSEDWPTVLMGNNTPSVLWSIEAPEQVQVGDYAKFVLWSDLSATDAQLRQVAEENNYYQVKSIDPQLGYAVFETVMGGFYSPDCVRTNMPLGEYTPKTDLFMPYPAADLQLRVLLCWYHAPVDGAEPEPIGYQQLDMQFVHANPNPFEVQVPMVPQTSMVTNAPGPENNDQPNPEAKVVQLRDGYVCYQLPENGVVYTHIKLPQGAARVTTDQWQEDWNDPYLRDGDGDGYISIRTQVMANPRTETYVLQFEDEQGSRVSTQQLVIVLSVPGVKAWPVYESGYQPIPTNRLHINNAAAQAGYTYQYNADNDGHLTTVYGTPQNTNGDQLDDSFVLEVRKPNANELGGQEARSYRITMRGGIPLGQDDFLAMNTRYEMAYSETTVLSGEIGPHVKQNTHRAVKPNQNRVTLYVPNLESEPDECTLMVVYWYAQENPQDDPDNPNNPDAPILCEYLWITTTEDVRPELTPLYASDDALPAPVPKPMAVSAELAAQGWQLQITPYIQKGDRSAHYELKLVNPQGETAQPPMPVEVYLPYPDGYAYDSETVAYDLNHYTDKLYKQYGADLNGSPVEMTFTEKGICYTASSFSPFIIDWEDGGAQPVVPVVPTTPDRPLPKTGDDSPSPLALLGLMLASALLAAGIRKKARA